MTGHFDLVVADDDAAGLCVAACAARKGARVALVRPEAKRPRTARAASAIPNFVWRRLDLQKYDLSFSPVSAIVSLSADGEIVKTVESVARSADDLETRGVSDFDVWSDFVREVDMMTRRTDRLRGEFALDEFGRAEGAGRANGRINGASPIEDLAVLSHSCTDFLDDYFNDERMKTHVGARALSAVGLGGAEPGSVVALAGVFAPSAWPVRSTMDAEDVEKALESACEEAGAEIFSAAVHAVKGAGEKFRIVALSDGQELKTRYLFCASPDAARRAGLSPFAGAAFGAASGAASATIRLKVSDDVVAPDGEDGAIFHLADDLRELQAARDAVVEGRLPDTLPIEFQFSAPGEIIAYTAYCPDRFMEDGEAREWTSQDRQALGARAIERLSSHLGGLGDKVVRSDVSIDGAYDGENAVSAEAPDPRIIVQPASVNTIAAAVTLADRLLHEH